VCFPLNVLMVYSLKLAFVANDNNLTSVGLIPGETICFGSLEFIADHFDNLSFSPEMNDSGVVFVGMVQNRSPFVHTILEKSSNEGDTALVEGGSSGFPDPRGCNVVTPTAPITTKPPPENTMTLVTIPTVQLWTTAPQPDIGTLLEQQEAY
jgi:hypothetical protein